jgi:hypothetical protein
LFAHIDSARDPVLTTCASSFVLDVPRRSE